VTCTASSFVDLGSWAATQQGLNSVVPKGDGCACKDRRVASVQRLIRSPATRFCVCQEFESTVVTRARHVCGWWRLEQVFAKSRR
jgi:hypothetical protein